MTTTKERFFLLATLGDANDDDNCILENFVDGIRPESWRVHKGEPLASVYPERARVFMSATDSGTRLGSLVGNTRSMLIASGPFRDIIEAHVGKKKIEYLPLAIHDHRKRLVGADYWLVNPLGAWDCIDLAKSDVLRDEDDPKEVLEVNEMVLDRARALKAPQLFRPEHNRSYYILRSELVADLEKAKLTNLVLKELVVAS